MGRVEALALGGTESPGRPRRSHRQDAAVTGTAVSTSAARAGPPVAYARATLGGDQRSRHKEGPRKERQPLTADVTNKAGQPVLQT